MGEEPAISRAWYQVWSLAVARPSVATYQSLARDPHASITKASIWLFIPTVIAWPIYILAQPVLYQAMLGIPWMRALSRVLIATAGAPIAGLFLVMFSMGIAALCHALARALGGQGTYIQLFSAFAAFGGPLILMQSLVWIVPLWGAFLRLPFALYGFVLSVIAMRAIHGFGWGKAAASAVVPSLGLSLLLVVCAVLAFFAVRSSQGAP